MYTHRAFTLIEVVITVGIFGVMMLVLVAFYVSTNASFISERDFVEVARGADDVMDAASRAILPARRVVASHTFPSGTVITGPTALVVQLPSVDASGNIISGKNDHIAFHASGTQAYRLIDTDPASARTSGSRILTDSLENLSFMYDNADFALVESVTVTVGTRADSKGTSLEHNLSQTFRLRNSAL